MRESDSPLARFAFTRLLAKAQGTRHLKDIASGAVYRLRDEFSNGQALIISPIQRGIAVAEANGATGAGRVIHVPDFCPVGPQWSLAFRARISGNLVFFQSGGFAFDGVNGITGGVQIRVQSSKLQFVRQGVAVVLTSAASWPTTRAVSVLLTFSGTQAVLYLDGVRDIAASYTYTFPETNAGQCIFLESANELQYIGFSGRVLTGREAMALHYMQDLSLFGRREQTYVDDAGGAPALPDLTALPRIDTARRQDRYIWTP